MSTDTKAERQTLAEIKATGYLDGYVDGPPPRMHPENLAIDQRVCREADCDNCGHHGLRYRAYHRQGSYLAFAICPACFHCAEF